MNRRLLALLAMLLLCATGCRYSRWALRDPDYARKYPEPTNNIFQRAKQALDGRHLDMKDGSFLAGGVSPDGQAVWADIGAMHYPEAWTESYLAFSGLYSDDLHDAFFGGKLGTRIQSPSRIAPFVGVGGLPDCFTRAVRGTRCGWRYRTTTTATATTPIGGQAMTDCIRCSLSTPKRESTTG